MSVKQDRQPVRTPTGLEQKYNFGQLRSNAQESAKQTGQLSQMNQSMSQYMAETNAAIADLAERNAQLEQTCSELETMLNEKMAELSKLEESAIILDAGGEFITLSDAGSRKVKSLILYGKTYQGETGLINMGWGGSVNIRVGVSEAYENPQTLAIFTPNGLPGVPVSEGGDYTDANGQQWIADHKDFARGVTVQRIGVIFSYAGEEIPGAFLSSTGSLTAGAKVWYVLPEAAETALPDGEIATFAELHTYNPGTVISNDAGAWMKVRYVADTKAYIDNQIERIV